MLDAKCKKKFHRYFLEYKNIHDVSILIFHFELYFNFPLINDAVFFFCTDLDQYIHLGSISSSINLFSLKSGTTYVLIHEWPWRWWLWSITEQNFCPLSNNNDDDSIDWFFSFVCFFVAFGESNKIKLFSPSTEGELLLFMMYAYMPCVKLAMF